MPGLSSRLAAAAFAFAVVLGLQAGAPGVSAQVVRLPAVAPEDGPAAEDSSRAFDPPSFPGQLASHPDSMANVLSAPGEVGAAAPAGVEAEATIDLPADVRPGMFQKLVFNAGWMARCGRNGMGQSDLELQAILALPCPTRDSPMIITPGFAVHYLDGPRGVDLPPRLHDAYVQFRWMSMIRPRLGADVAVTPGVYSDFERDHGADALRITGHGVLAWDLTERLKLVAGAGRFDRLEVDVLPVGGLIWTPSDDLKFDILFPQPKFARRVHWFGHATERVQDWLYLAAEFGGGQWAVARHAETDMVDLRDYRLLMGLERKVLGGLDGRVELGYVFGREIQFKSRTSSFSPTDTILLRGGLVY
jgi:hypothetical protein